MASLDGCHLWFVQARGREVQPIVRNRNNEIWENKYILRKKAGGEAQAFDEDSADP